jgi:glycine cleavage system H protein
MTFVPHSKIPKKTKRKIVINKSLKTVRMNFPTNLKYSASHEWIRIEPNNEAYIGISEYGVSQMGDILSIAVNPPNANSFYEKDSDMIGSIESAKAVSEIYMPVSGVILAINSKLANDINLLNEDMYGAGWIAKIKLSNPAELKDLMDATRYAVFIRE